MAETSETRSFLRFQVKAKDDLQEENLQHKKRGDIVVYKLDGQAAVRDEVQTPEASGESRSLHALGKMQARDEVVMFILEM